MSHRAHQSTVATQYILQHRAYDHNCKVKIGLILKFEAKSGEESPQFQYWSVVLELELLLNVYVRFQTSILHHVLDALTEMAK
jgi:hypothetical protein